MRSLTTLIVVLFSGVFATAVAAPSFSDKDVTNFVATMSELQGMDEKYPDIDLESKLQDPEAIASMVDSAGNLQLFQRVVAMTADHKGFQSDLKSAVTRNGFSSVDKFAKTADSIMMAYMAISISAEERAQIAMMTPEMLSMIPPQMQGQVKMAQKLVAASENVSAEDQATVTKHKDAIEGAMEN